MLVRALQGLPCTPRALQPLDDDSDATPNPNAHHAHHLHHGMDHA